jgi:hypothetical protein
MGEMRGNGSENILLGALLLIGLLHGLLFVFLVPPWQHYDEPTQFEYAWLVANRTSWPQPGDFDAEMRRQVLASMIENNFFRGSDPPSILSVSEPVWIGISQLGDSPVYYFLDSLPLRLIKFTDIRFQLYIARLGSVIFLLIAVFACWGAMGEIAPNPDHPLRWMVPTSLVLLPGFVDLMTSVNNDVGAIAFFTLFLWGCLRTMKRGLNLINLFWVLLTAALCISTKNTVFIAIPLTFLAILFSVFHGPRRKFAWAFLGIIVLMGLTLSFTWDENPARFYESNDFSFPTRVADSQAPLGNYIFTLILSKNKDNSAIRQPILPLLYSGLKGRKVTLGVWMWSDHPIQIYLPQMTSNNSRIGSPVPVSLNVNPQFFTYTLTIPKGTDQLWLEVIPYPQDVGSKTSVYFDGLTLAAGQYDANAVPLFSDSFGDSGVWGGKKFNNMIANSSAEMGWPGFTPWISAIIKTYFRIVPNSLWAGLDWVWAKPYFEGATGILFRTFWAKFGWGNVPLLGKYKYLTLFGISIIGLIGSILYFWKTKRELDKGISLFLLVSLFGVLGITYAKGLGSIFSHTQFPVARYAYPAILPILIILNAGWLGIWKYGLSNIGIPKKFFYTIFILLFLCLDFFSLWSLVKFYV